MDSSTINFEKTTLQQKSFEFAMPEGEDNEFLSESFDFINQLPLIKRNSKKKRNIKMISALYNPPSIKTTPIKSKSNPEDIKRKMEKVVHAHEELQEEKLLRQVSPKLFSYFSNRSKSTNIIPRLFDDRHRKSIMYLRRSPSVSPEIQQNLFSVSFNKEHPSQANLFFPLLVRKNCVKNTHPNKGFPKLDPSGVFFVQKSYRFKINKFLL
ncbi:hypothetical protein BpHYR1_043314 [Brachionus plicatilis]|uniref:Uncharacterized protein n=1 Tax=Brachionus plicatilis TaxID=10195 RepID=A0A3M7QI30_BRAPC|nr:hypothetical protein BpHYR1_043314 [Brachionus plicatilis]